MKLKLFLTVSSQAVSDVCAKQLPFQVYMTGKTAAIDDGWICMFLAEAYIAQLVTYICASQISLQVYMHDQKDYGLLHGPTKQLLLLLVHMPEAYITQGLIMTKTRTRPRIIIDSNRT